MTLAKDEVKMFTDAMLSNLNSLTVKEYMSAIGKKGGSAKSAAKTRAVRRNARKPRPGRRAKSQLPAQPA